MSPDTTTIALVTGANRGLGRATALALAAEGVDVIVTYRGDEEQAAGVVAEVEDRGRRAVALRLDTTAFDTFGAFADDVGEALREQWGRDAFDVLVNNAGHGVNAPFAETTREQFDGIFDVHVKGVFFLTQALLPRIADGGAIVNLSSGLARMTRPGMTVYGAAKGAVEVLTRYMAAELGARGIAVNVLAPGPTATDFGGGYLREDQAVRARLAGEAAMGRVGEPEDIGRAIAGLVTHTGRWITGQRIEASGGTRL